MNSVDENAIADFLEAGGRISRVNASVCVTESDLLAYLASCGIAAKYRGGDSRTYMCKGKRVSLTHLLAIANEHRRSCQLPPFAMRVAIRYAGPGAALSKNR